MGNHDNNEMEDVDKRQMYNNTREPHSYDPVERGSNNKTKELLRKTNLTNE